MSLLETDARPPEVEEWRRLWQPKENDGVELLPRRPTAYSVPPSLFRRWGAQKIRSNIHLSSHQFFVALVFRKFLDQLLDLLRLALVRQ